MKRLILALGLLTSLLGAQNVAITCQQWEIPRGSEADWVTLMQDQPDSVAASLRKQATQGKAKFAGMSLIQGRADISLSMEQIRELIFVSDYEPPELPPQALTPPANNTQSPAPTWEKLMLQGYQQVRIPPSYQSVPTAFEVRNTGTTVQFRATVSEQQNLSLQVAWEHVRLVGITDYTIKLAGAKDLAHQFPLFAVERTMRKLTMKPGQWQPFVMWKRNQPDISIILLMRVDVTP